MIVTSDISDVKEIHPKDKKTVGVRLANLALENTYKSTVGLVNGPLFKSFRIDEEVVTLSFDYADGLYFKNKLSNQFEVAGADGIFYTAEALIRNDQVVVSSKKVKNPVKVRFAWGNTIQSDLFNEVNLPASCFSTE
jgi:sialate O-acetylesterase